MSKEINLIFSKKKNKVSQEHLIKWFNFAAYTSVFLLVVISAAMYYLDNGQELPLLLKQEQGITQNLNLSQQKVLKLMLVKSRLGDINAITNGRSNFDQTINAIVTALPVGVVVNTFSLNKKAVDITVSSSSLSGVNQFLDFAMSKLNKKELFKTLTINGLTADDRSQTYSLALEAEPL